MPPLPLGPTDRLALKQDAGTDVLAFMDGDLRLISGSVDAYLALLQKALDTTPGNSVYVPGAGNDALIGNIKLVNTGASTRVISIYKPRNGSTTYDATTIWHTVTLQASEMAEWQGAGWVLYDSLGVPKMSVISPIAATQAELEAASVLTTFVSPGRMNFHPGMAKFWVDAVGTGLSINASFNVTSLTDTGAGLLTININVDFSSANYAAQVSVERASTALAVTNLSYCSIRNAGQAAGTLLVENWDGTAATAVQEDPASYYAVGYGDQ